MGTGLFNLKRRFQICWDFEAVVAVLNEPTVDGRVVTSVEAARGCCPRQVFFYSDDGERHVIGFFRHSREEDGRVIVTGVLRSRWLLRADRAAWRRLVSGGTVPCCMSLSGLDTDTDAAGHLVVSGRLADLLLGETLNPAWPQTAARLVLPVFVAAFGEVVVDVAAELDGDFREGPSG